MTLEYSLSFQGNPVGNTLRTLERTPAGTLRFTSSAQLGPQPIQQSVTVEPSSTRPSRLIAPDDESMRGRQTSSDRPASICPAEWTSRAG